MKKAYLSPSMLTVTIVSGRHLLSESMPLGSNKVENTEDIGFVKDNTSQQRGRSVWDDDWQ